MIDEVGDSGRSDGGIHHVRHEGEGSIVTTIALAVAELDAVDPVAMEPLYYAVDTDLLEALDPGHPPVSAEVSFTYRGYRITVEDDGGITVVPR